MASDLGNIQKFWVDEIQEINAALTGRFRETTLSQSSVLRNAGFDITAGDIFTKSGSNYKTKFDDYRLIAYRHHKLLYLGDWYDVFRYYRAALDGNMLSARTGGYIDGRNKLIVYIVVNLLGLASRKLADLVAVETPEIKPWKDAPAEVDAAIKRISDNSKLPSLIYNTALTGGVKGDSVWVVEPFEQNGETQVRIKRVMPETWFPDLDPSDLCGISSHRFAWRVKPTKETAILRQQIYIDGSIVHMANWLENEQVVSALTKDEEKRYLGDELPMPVTFEGMTTPLVVHIPNIQFDEQHPFGLSDYYDVKSPSDELSHRLTQLARELDKHADLSMRGPRLGKGEDSIGGYFTYQKDDPAPEYIQLPTQALDAMMVEIEFIAKWVLLLMEVAPGLVGLQETGGVERAEALRIKSNNSIVKSMRKQLYLTQGIKGAFKAAMELENSLGIASYPVLGEVGVKWKDGLPDSPTEKAMLAQIRTNAGKTWSVKDAVNFLDGDSAEETLKNIEEEEEAAPVDTMLPTLMPVGSEPIDGEAPPAEETDEEIKKEMPPEMRGKMKM